MPHANGGKAQKRHRMLESALGHNHQDERPERTPHENAQLPVFAHKSRHGHIGNGQTQEDGQKRCHEAYRSGIHSHAQQKNQALIEPNR